VLCRNLKLSNGRIQNHSLARHNMQLCLGSRPDRAMD
jgi:hypothetical protein